MFNRILEGTLPQWVTSSFPTIQAVLLVLITLCAIGIIMAIILQPAKTESGENAITGQSFDSYYMKNKASTREGRLEKLIIICISCLVFFTILYFISAVIYSPSV